jgi:transcriptional regulator with XRE-family HTH domain
MVIIGDRLKSIRESKNLSQGHIEKRTGLLRCYISRVENGHTVPSIETLEKLAQALEIPLYQLFYDGSDPKMLPVVKNADEIRMSTRDHRAVERLKKIFLKLSLRDRTLVHSMTAKLANRA